MTDVTIVKLELAINEVNAVLVALQELPAKLANPLTLKIKEQADKQVPKKDDK